MNSNAIEILGTLAEDGTAAGREAGRRAREGDRGTRAGPHENGLGVLRADGGGAGEALEVPAGAGGDR